MTIIPQSFVRQNLVFTFYFKWQLCTVKDLKQPLNFFYMNVHALTGSYTATVLEYSHKNDAVFFVKVAEIYLCYL